MTTTAIVVNEEMTNDPRSWAFGVPPGTYSLRPEFEELCRQAKAAIDRLYEEMFGAGE